MFQEKLKRIYTKIIYIVFALVVSAALWLYVEITENEIVTTSVTNIEIVLRNEDILNDKGMLVQRILTENVWLTFEGTRSDIALLRAPGAVSIEVDLATISSTGATGLVYTEILPQNLSNNFEIIGRSTSRVTLVVDRWLERRIEVRVNFTGGTASYELTAESPEFDPHIITVRGAEETVSKISYVLVTVLRDNLASTLTDDYEFVPFTEDDEELDAELLESIWFSQETIRVTIPVRELKHVPLSVALSHTNSTTDSNTSVRITPESVLVSGDPEIMRDLNNIPLGTIDMLRFGQTTTEAFPIILPNHVTNISGETEALVQVEVLGLSIGFRSITNFDTINVPPGLRAEILTQSLDIRIRGLESDILLVTPMNITVIADLSDVSTGTMSLPARVYILGSAGNVDVVGDYRLTVTVLND
ncbi:MAG: hypothetical protein LBC71_09030 [Oscillospiraceae bacterium]|jgi:YbbR domain-containing protein|nr:hypothetical protein [Oscillospiraceae bacterium]